MLCLADWNDVPCFAFEYFCSCTTSSHDCSHRFVCQFIVRVKFTELQLIIYFSYRYCTFGICVAPSWMRIAARRAGFASGGAAQCLLCFVLKCLTNTAIPPTITFFTNILATTATIPATTATEAGVGFLLLLPTQLGSNASLIGLSGACGDRSGDSRAFAYCTSVLLRLPGGYWASSRSIRDSLQYRLTLRFITNFFKLPTPRTQFISRFQPRPILSRRQVGGN